MELKQLIGSTYVLEGWENLGVYRLDEARCILLDTGMPGEGDDIVRTLAEAGLRVVGVLCTHVHIDHAGNNAYFRKKFGAKVAMSKGEAALCAVPLSVPAHVTEIDTGRVLKDLGCMVCPADVVIEPEDRQVELCGAVFRVVHTPGHSPDHVCFITPDNVCYVGDALLSGKELNAKLPCSFSPEADFACKRRLKGLGCTKYVVSHQGIYDDIDGLAEDNIALLRARLDAVKELVTAPMSMDEILAQVCAAFGLNGNSVPKAGYYEKNVRNYVYALYNEGSLCMEIQGGVRRYQKAE